MRGHDVDVRRPGPCGSIRTVNVSPCSSIAAGADAEMRSRGGSLPLVRQVAASRPRRASRTAELLERVLDLEQVGEVAARRRSRTVEVDRLVLVVEDRQLLVEAVPDRPLPDHRELGVDVDRPGARDQEEARLEVLQVVDRERVELLAVDRQDPASTGTGCRTRTGPSAPWATPRCRLARRRPRTCCRRGSERSGRPSSAPPLADGPGGRRAASAPSAAGTGAGSGREPGSPYMRARPGAPTAMALARPLARSSNRFADDRRIRSAVGVGAGDLDGAAAHVEPPVIDPSVTLDVHPERAGRTLRAPARRRARRGARRTRTWRRPSRPPLARRSVR